MTAGEITRLGESRLSEWAYRKQSTGIEFPPEWMGFRKLIHHIEWGRSRSQIPPLGHIDEEIEFPKMANWIMGRIRSYSYGDLGGFGLSVSHLEYRFARVVRVLSGWLQWSHGAQHPLFLLGTAHTGHEVAPFHLRMGKIRSPVAVLMTPSEIASPNIPNAKRPNASGRMRQFLAKC